MCVIASVILLPVGIKSWYHLNCLNYFDNVSAHPVRVCNGGSYVYMD